MKLLYVIFLLVGCSVNKTTQTPKTLYINADKSVKNIRIINVEDSRCPEGVNCFTKGRAKITIETMENGEIKILNLFSDQTELISLFGKKYRVSKLSPYPKKGMTLSLNDYTLQIDLSK